MKGFRVLGRGSLCIILSFLFGFSANLAEGIVHYVGGSDGWVLSPFESYNHWTGRRRFQVHDTLVFTYERGDSVLVVNETDYNTCNPSKPIQSLTGGYSVFEFDRSGPFFFISGIPGRCYHAQKLVIVVMAPRKSLKNPPIGGAALAPSQAISPSPIVSFAQPPSTSIGIAPANAPSGTDISNAPASAPSGTGVGIAPVSGQPGLGGFGLAPAYGPSTQPRPTANAFAARISWLLFGFVFVVYI